MQKWIVSSSLAAALAVAPLGCQTVGGALGGLTGVAADVVLPPAEEERLGRQLQERVEQELRVHPDPQVQRYLQRIGQDVVRSAERRGEVPDPIQFDFTVIDDDEQVNAFVLPGGKVYVFSGLLQAAESEAEVAGILAHEVAHVTRRHVAQRLTAQYGISALATLALGRDPGLAQQIAAQIIGTGALLSFSREQEREADQFALPYMVEAGYSPEGLVTFFERMSALSGRVPGVLQLLQTHPAPAERVELARAQIAAMEERPTRLGRAEHEDFKRNVL